MLLLFLILFIVFEAVLLKKKDPEPWRHVFSIIYYGFGDANRYSYYAKSNKIKQVFLSKVRNQNGLTREEFDSLPARELQSMIEDPVLVKFVFENKNYSLTRRSLKPSAWIIFATWTFFAVGPGLLIGNELFGKPLNVESWSFGIPSIWVWNILFWVLGILMVWFLAIKMEMSTSMEKNISPYSDDFSN